MKQTQRILNYMQQFGGITQAEALQMCGCSRLAARIADLKSEGYAIKSIRKSGTNRFGDKTSYCEYQLERPA